MRAADPARPATRGERLQARLLSALMALLGRLRFETASGLGGWLFRGLGPHLPLSGRARRNLVLALPELSSTEHEAILRRMWDNLGRVAFEYAHLHRIRCFPPQARVEIVGLRLLEEAIAAGPVICVSAHYGNWEILMLAAAQRGLGVTGVARPPNNPAVDRLLADERHRAGIRTVAKGGSGARQLVSIMRSSGALAMLVDQKLNDGIETRFFDKPAMTAPAAAEFAYRYGARILPVVVERVGGTRFRLSVEAPVELPPATDRAAAVHAVTTEINRRIEAWIRRDPGQWFWLHRRWIESR